MAGSPLSRAAVRARSAATQAMPSFPAFSASSETRTYVPARAAEAVVLAAPGAAPARLADAVATRPGSLPASAWYRQALNACHAAARRASSVPAAGGGGRTRAG